MSYKSHQAGAERVFDHVYDNNYTTSGVRDLWKANNMALAKSAPIYIVPIYKTMFTDLPRVPRRRFMMQQNPLPHYSHYQGGDDITRSKKLTMSEIHGSQRNRFFYAPLAKSMPSITKPPIIEQSKAEPNSEIREIGCQTVYRESSAQTSAWMPNAVVHPSESEVPEIVYVADMIKNKTLPGVVEADLVDRARRRRKWEKTLPQFLKMKDFAKKQTVIQAFEWEQWISREDEIIECQRLRLNLVRQIFKRRDDKIKQNADAKVASFYARNAVQTEAKKQKLKIEYQRAVRKLELKHKNISKKYGRADIANEHIDRASDLYGPQLRFGQHPRQKHVATYDTSFEPRLSKMLNLDASIADVGLLLKRPEKLWAPKEQTKEFVKGFWDEKNLAGIYQTLQEFRQAQEVATSQSPECMMPKTKKEWDDGVCFKTKPSVSSPDVKRCLKSIFLQKIIKGRVVQNILNHGRTECRDLISELQKIHELPCVLEMYKDEINEQLKRRLTNARMRELHDETPSYTSVLFEFLTGELIRLKDQRKAHALYLLSEQVRCRQEVVDLDCEGDLDEIYKKLTTSNEDTIGRYLEDVLLDGVDELLKIETRKKIRELANDLCAAANDSKLAAKSIMDSPIMTDINKLIAAKEVAELKQKKLEAAHRQIHHIPKKKIVCPCSAEQQVVSDIIDDILEKVLGPPASPLSSIDSNMDVGLHEAKRAIDMIFNKTISPPPNLNTTSIKDLESETDHIKESELTLREIIGDINERLLFLTFERIDADEK